ncbi:MAG TPA: NAD(P)H-dependent oxidoreductase [Aestuariivirga sp.]|nr:NAD(P)H-dependent oxidoreductase [Aestuariivirga sp.]
MTQTVAVLVGSLRKESLTRKLALALAPLAPKGMNLKMVEIGDLPLFNADHENDPPAAVKAFKKAIEAADAVLFATPEYNRSVPGALKNAIDWGSRPYGMSSWSGKPAAVISQSMGALSGFGANHHLRQSLVFLNMPTMAQPEAYIANSTTLFDDKGGLAKAETKDFLTQFMAAFGQWISTHRA